MEVTLRELMSTSSKDTKKEQQKPFGPEGVATLLGDKRELSLFCLFDITF